MSVIKKIKKLINNPSLFIEDCIKKHVSGSKKFNKKNSNTYYGFPREFNISESNILDYSNFDINYDDKIFAYIPWIESHSCRLVKEINKSREIEIHKINLFSCRTLKSRRSIMGFARNNPLEYKYFLRNKFIPLKSRLSAVIFTFDWSPVMRLAVEVCQELNIPTILIPHESIFLDKNKYYWDAASYASVPKCDMVLVWGELQKRIFIERGYPENHIYVVGSPKLDNNIKYIATLNREQFCHCYGFNPALPIILFASQVLDIQIDQTAARQAQRQAISDLLEFCKENQYQLLVRQPPNGADILDSTLRNHLKEVEYANIDHSSCYQTSPEESIFHSDIVISINSTMLLEAVLMNRKAFSIRYIDITSIWNSNIIPYGQNKKEVFDKLLTISKNSINIPDDEFKRLKNEFSIGDFDGKSCKRICDILNKVPYSSIDSIKKPSSQECLTKGKRIDVICINLEENNQTLLHLRELLNCNTLLYKNSLQNNQHINSVDLFIQWGIQENSLKEIQRVSNTLGRSFAYIEDGFIHNPDDSEGAKFSIVVDDLTVHYDATRPSRLETYLASNEQIDETTRKYCKQCIDKIVKQYSSERCATIGHEEKKKLLLIDQHYDDMSVGYGLANEQTFKNMLKDAINNYSDWDIIIKQHPDTIKKGAPSYFNKELLSSIKHLDNISIVDYDINQYNLFNIADEVFVCTSLLGFEACMAGKKVHCYGMPFYAGWGITNDKISIPRRNRQRDLLDIFYFSYIKLSRYVSPASGVACSLGELIEHLYKK